LLQVLSYAQVVLQAIPIMLGEASEWPPGRTEQQKLDTVLSLDALAHAADAPHGHLQMLYDLNLRIALADTEQCRLWTNACCRIQRAWRWNRFRLKVMADLDHPACTQPLVLAMESALQIHGIEHLLKARPVFALSSQLHCLGVEWVTLELLDAVCVGGSWTMFSHLPGREVLWHALTCIRSGHSSV
jgi:hypothetical protein